jgi:hypothetical protein
LRPFELNPSYNNLEICRFASAIQNSLKSLYIT